VPRNGRLDKLTALVPVSLCLDIIVARTGGGHEIPLPEHDIELRNHPSSANVVPCREGRKSEIPELRALTVLSLRGARNARRSRTREDQPLHTAVLSWDHRGGVTDQEASTDSGAYP